MFEKIKKAIKKELSDRMKKELDGIMPKWRQNDFLKPAERRKRDKGEISGKELKAIIKDRVKKHYEKKFSAECQNLDRIAQAEDFDGGKITVEWKKSKTWGANPHAEFCDYGSLYYGSASGCGYDKLSAAVSECLNQSDKLLKLLYLYREKHLKEHNEAVFGYGSGCGILPYFEGGVGCGCYPEIFEKIGFKFREVASGEMFNAFEITKIDKKRVSKK